MARLYYPDFVLQDSFFSYLYHAIMNFQKISKSYLRVLRTQQQCSKFQNFRLSTKKVIETQKCTQAARLLVLYQYLTYYDNFEVPLLLNKFSVCAEIFRVILSHIYLSSGEVSSRSELVHVQPWST